MAEPTLIQRNVEKYFNKLPEKWNVDGTLKGDPANLYVMVTPDGRQVSEPFDRTKGIHIPLMRSELETGDRVSDLSAVLCDQ